MILEIDTYLEYLLRFDKALQLPGLSSFVKELSVCSFKKNEYYLADHTIPNDIGFIVKGLVRSFVIDDTGGEKTINFFPEMNYVGDYDALVNRVPTRYSFRFLEKTTLVRIPRHALLQGYKQYPQLARHGKALAEEKLTMQNQRLKSFITQTAEERYLDFVTHRNALFNRVSLTDLSSYLGIERQSLTRIRKKIARR